MTQNDELGGSTWTAEVAALMRPDDLLSLHIYRGTPEEMISGISELLANWDAQPQTAGQPFYVSKSTDASQGKSGEVDWNESVRNFQQETISRLIEIHGDRFRGLIDHSMGDPNPYTTDDGSFWPVEP